MKNSTKKNRKRKVKVKSVSYLFVVILIFVSVASCQNRPKEVLSRKQMEKVMYDVYIAEALIENDFHQFNTPEKKEAYIKEVFSMNRITQTQWDSSLSWYSDRIDLYLKMNDSVKARLQRHRTNIDELLEKERSRQSGDLEIYSASYIPKTFFFSTPSIRNGFRFELDSLAITERIEEDDFSFTFSVMGIPADFQSRFTSLLSLQYGDTTLYELQHINENKAYSFKASKFFDNDTLVQVAGFVHLQDTTARVSQINMYNIVLGNHTYKSDSLLLRDNEPVKEKTDDIMRPIDQDSI